MGAVVVLNGRWYLGAMSTARTTFALYPIKVLLLYAVFGILALRCIAGEKETLNLSSTNKSMASGRRVRSVSNPPQPRDCVLSTWSSWSLCDPCQKKRYRFARLEQPSQFNGDPCDYSDKETEDCVTNNPCRNKVRCDGFVCAVTDSESGTVILQNNGKQGNKLFDESFTPRVLGRCITRRLLCNGDDDCGDRSDEKNCKKVFKKCDQKMEQYWGIENLAKGLNIFTNDLEGLVLDHRYYAGGCSPHYIVDTRFRKPYNVESYTPETKGKYEFTMTEYDSYSNYESSVLKAKASQSSFSFGIKIPGVFELGYSSNDNRFKKFIQRMKRFSSTISTRHFTLAGVVYLLSTSFTRSGHTRHKIRLAQFAANCIRGDLVAAVIECLSKFIHARSELAVAVYKLKPRALMLHYEFLQRLRQLPSEYSYGEYRELYRDYGTHYITEATVGGIYEYTLVMNSEELQKAGYSLSDVQKCAQHGFNIGARIHSVYLSLGITEAACKSLLKEIGDSTSKKQYVEDFIALVRGGASEHITTLAYKDLPTAQLMQEWGDAVQYNPEIIKLKAEPLYQLVTPTDFANAITIKENLRRALEEFQLETSSCRCAPCHGNAIPFLQGTRCECLCPLGYSGTACEISKRKDAAVNGNWGCWTSWSPCSGGQRTRRRQCNNPAPQNAGSSCSGPDAETVTC